MTHHPKPLTRAQRKVLDFIAAFIAQKGYGPTHEDIGRGVGLSSIATVHVHIVHLQRKGWISRGYAWSGRAAKQIALTDGAKESFHSGVCPACGRTAEVAQP